jgi:hypothetical protein
MDSWRVRPKMLVWGLSFLFVVAWLTPVTAQGLFGAGLPGLSSVEGFLSRPSGCGEKMRPGLAAPVFYVGWMEDRNGTGYELSSDDGRLSHQYPLRGVWLGLGETIALSDSLGAVLSAWVLVQGNNTHTSELDGNTPYEWERTPSNWYFLDGLLSYKCAGGFTGLAGFRYEYYTSHFRKLNPPVSPDSGDVKINNYIPLLGVQWDYVGTETNLLFRTVGFPALFGNFDLVELFGLAPFEAKGNYNNGYFLEVFSEYSRKFGGMNVGVFGRWNLAHTTSNANAGDVGTPRTGFSLGLQRTTWTLGGSFSLAFNSPL